MDLVSGAGAELMLRVKAMPGSGSRGIAGPRAEELVVRLNASPEKGKANRELLELLADELGLARSSLRIVSGQTSRHKVVGFPASALAGVEKLVRETGGKDSGGKDTRRRG